MGTLYICSTPIGNLEDITLRTLRVLKEVDLIAAEDTRQTIKLLNHFDIKKKMISYHEHNKYEKTQVLIDELMSGKDVALVSDAGTPIISDPGFEVVREAANRGIEVTATPGVSAVITALTLSGLDSRGFVFFGFLPRENKERSRYSERISKETYTMVFYEARHRLLKTLEYLCDQTTGNRRISICKELTKKHEDVYRTTLEDAICHYRENEPRGEFVLVLEGKDVKELEEEEAKKWDEITIEEHMEIYLGKGMGRKEAMKKVAGDRNVSKNDIYKALIKEN